MEVAVTDPSEGSNSPANPQRRRHWQNLVKNIVAGARLALFMRVRAEAFSAGTNQAGLALLALFSVYFFSEYLANLPQPEFNGYGVSFAVSAYAVMVGALWLSALLQRRTDAFSLITVMMACASIVTTAIYVSAYFLIQDYLEGRTWYIVAWSAYYAVIAWTALIAMRIFRLVFGLSRLRSVGLAIFYAAASYGPSMLLPYQPIWQEGYDASDHGAEKVVREPIDVERVFYRQHELVGQVLDGLDAGRPDVTDLYFVGFAGYGAQDVFMKEVTVASSLFDERFDTQGRSANLINNPQTIDRQPLANGSNLRLLLNGLGAKMDRGEDVLFLFLTSHGTKDRLSTRLWPIRQNDLTASDLRRMLDDAGIIWRVIVISACYSGSFVDELQSENTLVITASQKDRTSFGCSNEADMTYFGRALIDEALRKTRSFTEAYDLATQAVTAREQTEGKTPSEPQISIGSRMPAKLAELTKRLDALGDVAARD